MSAAVDGGKRNQKSVPPTEPDEDIGQEIAKVNGNGHAVDNSFALMIIDLARDPNFDAAKLVALWKVNERNLEEQRKQRAEAAELAFNDDMAKAQGEFPVIAR